MAIEALARSLGQRDHRGYDAICDGLSVGRITEPGGFEAMVYEPLVCLIVQGSKETGVSGSRVHAAAGDCVVVSHAVPVLARITEASPDVPYLAVIAHLDLAELRSLYDEVGDDLLDETPGAALSVAPISDATLDVLVRYVALADAPADQPVLGPLLRRELHYRLLQGPSGGMLRRLLRRDSHASRIAQAIQHLRAAFRDRLEMGEIAEGVGMSPSSFYKHFKAVTSTTPLQYQKQLRLTESRRLLLTGEHSVSTAAYAVGYESPSQFSREYAREFGEPPRNAIPAAA